SRGGVRRRPHFLTDPRERVDLTSLAALRPLGAVLRAAVAPLGHAGRVERTAHRVVTHARKILHAATANQDDRVLLQIVAFAADVADDFVTVGQVHLGTLAQ